MSWKNEVVAAAIEDGLGLLLVVVEGVPGDGRVFEVRGRVEPQGDRLLAFAFVVVFALFFVVFGLFLCESHGCGSAGVVIAQAKAQGAVAYPFAVESEGARKGSEVGLQPSVEAFGEFVGVDPDEQVARGGVAGNFSEGALVFVQKA